MTREAIEEFWCRSAHWFFGHWHWVGSRNIWKCAKCQRRYAP